MIKVSRQAEDVEQEVLEEAMYGNLPTLTSMQLLVKTVRSSVGSASDHSMLRQLCTTEIDILGVAETKLEGEEILAIPGYLWFGHNRKNLHRNAKCGSGGVGFFIRDSYVKRTLLLYWIIHMRGFSGLSA